MRWKALAATVLITATATAVPATPAAAAPLTKVLVFSKTAGFRHSSIPQGVAAIQQLGSQNGFGVTATEDAGQFTTANLAQYQAVVWLSTTGDVLNDTQQAAFESYVNGGGGYVGVHAAADTEYAWTWYGTTAGAYFHSHPAIQTATVRVEDRTTDATAHLPAAWSRTDEWYNYQTNPRSGGAHVLATLDESTYSGGTMGADHPISWCKNVGGGRAWYTGLGHTEESYSEANFTRMLLGGIRIAAQSVSANCGGVVSTDLARGRPTTASSVESATYPATNAVDGNAGTRWSSQFADPQWIRVDLGSVRALNRVKLTWEGAYGRAYQIQTSTDGTAWTTAATVTNSDGGVDESTLSASARYVRVYGTQRATQWGYSLWDLNVYGA
ncbi:hypothetical protein Acsp02_25580 [Actinoplanes sp. NBRC 103695]|nr:hypothetical protein Acsp02_25580 [Actinoplanes sp. NBRC 103695]